MKILIQNGRILDPAERIDAGLNLLLTDGKIAGLTSEAPEADLRIDASGKVVCPGLIDIHMHEDPLDPDGRLYADTERGILFCMLRQGVTTAVAGNCGENRAHPLQYLDTVDRDGAPVNLAMFAGHGYFRTLAGAADKYAPAARAQIEAMNRELARCLEHGCVGISYGIRYIPGMNRQELLETAALCRDSGKPIAAHIRDDADAVFGAAEEFLDAGLELGLPTQVSHIGSMAGFGQMSRFLRLIDSYRARGLDVSCDCYPYAAFSTDIGETTYDDGWLERYHCGYDAVEMAEGRYRGQRLTEERFREMRREHPEYKTVCYVMQQADVDLAYGHPGVMVASDGTLSHGQGHPRAAGCFPRVLGTYVREGKLSLYDAVSRMTAEPAARLRLRNKGTLRKGADADVLIFDPETIADRATFSDPLLPPVGIDWVIVNGTPACSDGVLLCTDAGRSVRR